MTCRNASFFSLLLSACFILGVINAAALAEEATGPLQEVPATRLQTLSRGVNLQGWLLRPHELPFDDIHEFVPVSDADLSLIRSLGLTHVRLCIDPAALVDLRRPTELAPNTLACIDAAIQRITAHDLGVVIDIHAYGEIKAALGSDDKLTAAYTDFWATLAKHLSTTDPERVFLEILNEPNQKDRYRWMGVQAKIAEAIRDNAPAHTIVATGPWSSSVADLTFIPPLADRNVVYTIHYYEPLVFTHQGVNWGGAWLHPPLGHVPYPATADELAPILAQFPTDSRTWNELMNYQNAHWDAESIGKKYQLAADWAQKNHIPLINGEFGVYARVAPPDSRARWLHDARVAAETRHIGWTLWDFDAGFGLVSPQRIHGVTVLDKNVAAALGLTF